MSAGQFERITELTPAWDKRHTDPTKNYGIGAVMLRMVLKGPAGAVQFVASTGWYLPHVQPVLRDGEHPLMGWDIGYHSPTPQYEGQEPFGGPDNTEPCEYLGVPCYYDGSSLQGIRVAEVLLEEGSDAVWALLEDRYRDLFGGDEVRNG